MASASQTYLKITECLVAGSLKPALLQPHRNLAAENMEITHKITELEEYEDEVARLLKDVQVALDAEKSKPVAEDEDPKIRVDICDETAQLNAAAQKDLAGVERALSESKEVNYENGMRFRQRMQAMDVDLDKIIQSAKSVPSLTEVKEEDLRRLFTLEPKPQGKAMKNLIEKLDPQNTVGLEESLKKFIESAQPEVKKILDAKLELITEQQKRSTRTANEVKKVGENMESVDAEVDMLSQKVGKELPNVMKNVPRLAERNQHRPQMN